MRRKDRAVTDFAEILAIVDRCEIVRLGMIADGRPYVVPMHFGYLAKGETLCLFMHSAREGRKIDTLRESPQVFFEMDGATAVLNDDAPCHWSASFESVMGEGAITFLEDPTERQQALAALMTRYGFEGEPVFDPAVMNRTAILRLDVLSVTAKRSPAR